ARLGDARHTTGLDELTVRVAEHDTEIVPSFALVEPGETVKTLSAGNGGCETDRSPPRTSPAGSCPAHPPPARRPRRAGTNGSAPRPRHGRPYAAALCAGLPRDLRERCLRRRHRQPTVPRRPEAHRLSRNRLPRIPCLGRRTGRSWQR